MPCFNYELQVLQRAFLMFLIILSVSLCTLHERAVPTKPMWLILCHLLLEWPVSTCTFFQLFRDSKRWTKPCGHCVSVRVPARLVSFLVSSFNIRPFVRFLGKNRLDWFTFLDGPFYKRWEEETSSVWLTGITRSRLEILSV